MKIPPAYILTTEILALITKIEVNRVFFNSIPVPTSVKEKIQRVSLLKSSLFSARIEGNPLTYEEIETTTEKEKKAEIFNILEAIKYIDKNIILRKKITVKLILKLHKLVMKDLAPEAGFFRKEMGAIFNQSGVAVYVSPPPSQIPILIDKLLSYINNANEKFPLLTAFVAHLVFEKIHPFIDGNGRVGRLLIFAIVKSKGWNSPLFIPLEEYLDSYKDKYYYHLDTGLKKIDDYLLFMLEAYYQETEKIKSQIAAPKETGETILLPPRQEEIYNIIKDHRMVSFDAIRRRFLKVPPRTLRYDIKKLQEKKLVIKIGSTKGSYYAVKK